MKLSIAILAVLVFLSSCSPYKQLKPKPEIFSREGEYIQLLNKDKRFKLKQGKKYYMIFPGTPADNTYLVLRGNDLRLLTSHLTRQFTKGKGDIPVTDESAADDNVNVYKIDRAVPTYYWVIEDVRQTLEMTLDYRYVPVWRYRFETRSAEFQLTLARNKVDRGNYEALGSTLRAQDLRYEQELADTRQKNQTLKSLQGELQKIEAIFPPAIKNSDDKAYLDYVGLKNELERELRFQENYQVMLNAFSKANAGGDAFAQAAPDFMAFFERKNEFADNVVQEARQNIGSRLAEIAPYLEKVLQQKNDISPIDYPIDKAEALFRECNQQPDARFTAVAGAIRTFNRDAEAIANARNGLDDIKASLETTGEWPSDSFYPRLQSQIDRLAASLPRVSASTYGKFSAYRSVTRLDQAARAAGDEIRSLQLGFQTAAALVPQINRLKAQSNYSEIIRLLKLNPGLDFLVRQYGNIDQLSLQQQESDINLALENRLWSVAESKIRALYEDRNFLNYDTALPRKNQAVKNAEERLVSAVEEESRKRINAFIEANKAVFQNVDSLYANPAFTPVHELGFSSGGASVLEANKKRIQNYLDSFRFDQFPKMSIENLYREFERNPGDNGVARARAIVTHGKYYKGTDRKIRNLVAECDPQAAKWITKPTEYRKIYVLPVNANSQANNDYVFKLNIQIESDAQFPVFDVNIKLPREVASRAGQQQWYERITMNGNVLKNEGRFTITSPTPENGFECQLSPVQMVKNRDNILEVRFKHSAFKVLEVSVMCQRPLIKKN